MARKLSFVLALAVMAAVALLLNLSSAPQIGVAGQPPDKPHDPADEVVGVINTNEDVKVDIPLSANHNDGTIGCEELDFTTSNDTNGTVGTITPRLCNTTELARDLTAAEFYDPNASEDGAGAGTCSDGIDNDTATVPDGLIDADDPDCLVGNAIPVVSIGGLDKAEGVIQIGDELINFVHTHPAGHSDCEGDGSDKDSSPPCLHGITRGAFKTTAAVHTAGDTVIFRSELGDVAADDNISVGITADSPDKGEALVLNSSAGFPVSEGVVMVDDELIIYRATKSGQLQDIIRGALGSTAAVHTAKAHVFLIEPGFYGTLVEEIDSVQTILRITTLTGYGLNGGIVEVENEVIIYEQTGSTNAECEGASPCLLGLTRSAFGTTSKLHETGTTVFTAAGDDIDQATANFTPANQFNDDQKNLSVTVRDTDSLNPVDETSTIIPVDPPTKAATATMAELGFDASGGLLTLQQDGPSEVVTYTAIGTVDADCAPYAAPCFTGVTRSVTNLTAINPPNNGGVFQVSKSGGAGFLYNVGKDNLASGDVLVTVKVNEVNDAPEFKAGAKQTAILEQGTIEGGFKETNPQTNITLNINDLDNCHVEVTVTSLPDHGTLNVPDGTGGKDPLPTGPIHLFVTGCDGKMETGTGVENLPLTDKVPNTFATTLHYVPDTTFTGSDSFTVEVVDQTKLPLCPPAGGTGCTTDPKAAQGSDTLVVNLTNTPPTAGPVDKVDLATDATRTIVLMASDPDTNTDLKNSVRHCELNFTIIDFPDHGFLEGGAVTNQPKPIECIPGSPNTDSATIRYTPDTGYNGPDSFTYRVYDRTGKGADNYNRVTFTVQLNVSPIVPPLKDLVFGDVDCDGDVDGVDALKIQRWIIGLSVTQEPGCLEIGSDY